MPILPTRFAPLVRWRGRSSLATVHGDRLAVAFLVLAVLAAFSPAWARGELFYESDTVTYYAPFAAYAAETLAGGSLPLWNPYVYMGYPQFADGETGVLFPLHFFTLATGQVEWLLLWGPVIRSLLAALAAYWFARSLRISPAGAALTGLAFGLGSFAVAQQHHLNVANSIFVLPAMLASVERALSTASSRKRLGWFGLGGIFFALALVAVHPQIVIIVGIGVALHLILSFAAGRWRVTVPGWRPRAAWVLAGGLLMLLAGLGLGALQAIPLYELITQSLRGDTISLVEASRFAVLPVAGASCSSRRSSDRATSSGAPGIAGRLPFTSVPFRSPSVSSLSAACRSAPLSGFSPPSPSSPGCSPRVRTAPPAFTTVCAWSPASTAPARPAASPSSSS